MAVSMAIVPLLKGEAAKAIKRDISRAKIVTYSDEERKATDEKIEKILEKKHTINQTDLRSSHSIAVKHDSTPNVERLRGRPIHKEDTDCYSITISISFHNNADKS